MPKGYFLLILLLLVAQKCSGGRPCPWAVVVGSTVGEETVGSDGTVAEAGDVVAGEAAVVDRPKDSKGVQTAAAGRLPFEKAPMFGRRMPFAVAGEEGKI